MLKRRKELETQDDTADVKTRTVQHNRHFRLVGRNQGDPVHKGFAAGVRFDDQTGSVLPVKGQMPGTDTGTGDDKVTGTQGAENAFPRDREPGVDRKLIAAGNDDHLTDIPCLGQVAKAFAALSALVVKPGEGEEQEHQGKKGKKIAGSCGYHLIDFR